MQLVCSYVFIWDEQKKSSRQLRRQQSRFACFNSCRTLLLTTEHSRNSDRKVLWGLLQLFFANAIFSIKLKKATCNFTKINYPHWHSVTKPSFDASNSYGQQGMSSLTFNLRRSEVHNSRSLHLWKWDWEYVFCVILIFGPGQSAHVSRWRFLISPNYPIMCMVKRKNYHRLSWRIWAISKYMIVDDSRW